MSEPVRLNKWIAQMGIASRREADRLIDQGRVTVNGTVVAEKGLKVDPDADTVEVDTAGLAARTYVALHKPAGYVSLAKPLPDEPNVVTALVDVPGLFPVGRLDRDTTGLILLTDDGTLVTALNHPGRAKEKEYEVRVDRPVPDGALARLAAGVPLMGTRTRPAKIRRTAPDAFRIVLTEGRNRQVRRMCRKVACNVVALQRVRIDCVALGDLPVGRWRHLTPEEVRGLKAP
jgi:23S rRNA pseudouridine2605 synthase